MARRMASSCWSRRPDGVGCGGAAGGSGCGGGGVDLWSAFVLLLLLWFASSTDPTGNLRGTAAATASSSPSSVPEFFHRCRGIGVGRYLKDDKDNNLDNNDNFTTTILEDLQDSPCEPCRYTYEPKKALPLDKESKKMPHVVVLLSSTMMSAAMVNLNYNSANKHQHYHHNTFETSMVLTAGLLTRGFRVTVVLSQHPEMPREEFLRPSLSQHIPCRMQAKAHSLLKFVTYQLDESTRTTLQHCQQAQANPHQAVHAVFQNQKPNQGGDKSQQSQFQNHQQNTGLGQVQVVEHQFFMGWSSQHVMGCSILTAAPTVQAMTNAVDFRKFDVLIADAASVAGAFTAEAFMMPSILLVDSTSLLEKVAGTLPPTKMKATTTTTATTYTPASSLLSTTLTERGGLPTSLLEQLRQQEESWTGGTGSGDGQQQFSSLSDIDTSWYSYIKSTLSSLLHRCLSTYDGFDWTYAFVGVNRVRRSLGLPRIRGVADIWKAPGCVLWSLAPGSGAYRSRLHNLVGTVSTRHTKIRPGTPSRPFLPPCIPCSGDDSSDKQKRKKKSAPKSTSSKRESIPTVAISAGFQNHEKGRSHYRSILQGLSIARASLHEMKNSSATGDVFGDCWVLGQCDFRAVFMTPLPDFTLPDWCSYAQSSFLNILADEKAKPTAALVSLCDENNLWTHMLGPPVVCWQSSWEPHEFAFQLLNALRQGNPIHSDTATPPTSYSSESTTNNESNGTAINAAATAAAVVGRATPSLGHVDALEDIVNLTEKLAMLKKTVGKTQRWKSGYDLGNDVYDLLVHPFEDAQGDVRHRGGREGGRIIKKAEGSTDATTPLLQVLLYPAWLIVCLAGLYLLLKDSILVRNLFRSGKRSHHPSHHQYHSSSHFFPNPFLISFTAGLMQIVQESFRHFSELDRLCTMWQKWTADVSVQLGESGGSDTGESGAKASSARNGVHHHASAMSNNSSHHQSSLRGSKKRTSKNKRH